MLKALIARHVTVRLTTVVGIVALEMLLMIACVIVLLRNQTLQNNVVMYRALAAPAVGQYLPPITGIDWAGSKREVVYGQDVRPTLIYELSKDCGACVSNWVAMRAVQRMSPNRLRIVYVDTIDALSKDYLREHGMDSDIVFSRLDPDVATHYNARATPQSLLVDQTGRLVWSRVGSFSTADTAELLEIVEKVVQQLSETKGVLQ